jgi:uncharacterized protein YrrD
VPPELLVLLNARTEAVAQDSVEVKKDMAYLSDQDISLVRAFTSSRAGIDGPAPERWTHKEAAAFA